MLMRNRLPLLLLTFAASSIIASSQISSGNDSIYKLPYKNTYVKNVFVTDNVFRTMKPEITRPRSFDEAREIRRIGQNGG